MGTPMDVMIWATCLMYLIVSIGTVKLAVADGMPKPNGYISGGLHSVLVIPVFVLLTVYVCFASEAAVERLIKKIG